MQVLGSFVEGRWVGHDPPAFEPPQPHEQRFVGLDARLLTQARELLEAGAEQVLHALDLAVRLEPAAAVAVELSEVYPGPESLLEVRELHLRAPQQQRALHDHAPGHDRCHEQHDHDQLDRDARLGDQGPERQLLVHAGISLGC